MRLLLPLLQLLLVVGASLWKLISNSSSSSRKDSGSNKDISTG
jgi:hypothetical protein